jgi:hypothetical protein
MSVKDIPLRGGRATFLGWWPARRIESPAGEMAQSAAAAESLASASAVAEVGGVDVGAIFARALREHSNLEQDWLWLATIVTAEAERRYCFERALYIDPHSVEAREELARLDRRSVTRAAGLRRRHA